MKGAQKLLTPLARSTSRCSDSVCKDTHGDQWCVRHQNKVIPARSAACAPAADLQHQQGVKQLACSPVQQLGEHPAGWQAFKSERHMVQSRTCWPPAEGFVTQHTLVVPITTAAAPHWRTCQSFRPPAAATGPTTGQLAALRALMVARCGTATSCWPRLMASAATRPQPLHAGTGLSLVRTFCSPF